MANTLIEFFYELIQDPTKIPLMIIYSAEPDVDSFTEHFVLDGTDDLSDPIRDVVRRTGAAQQAVGPVIDHVFRSMAGGHMFIAEVRQHEGRLAQHCQVKHEVRYLEAVNAVIDARPRMQHRGVIQSTTFGVMHLARFLRSLVADRRSMNWISTNSAHLSLCFDLRKAEKLCRLYILNPDPELGTPS